MCCLGTNRERRKLAGGRRPRHSNGFDDRERRSSLQRADECVQRGARTLGDDLDSPAVREVSNLAVEGQASTCSGDKKAKANTLYTATDGCVEPLRAFGVCLHVRAARPVRARRGAVRG